MKERYARQMSLSEIGEAGQEKLKNARVLVIGAGGLGSPVLTYLVSAGIGTIRMIEEDQVGMSNLNRQFLYTSKDMGRDKAIVAREQLEALNPEVHLEVFAERLTETNIATFTKEVDVIVDCVDNLETRLLLNKVAIEQNIPLVEGGVEGFCGFATVVTRNSACLECLGIQEMKPAKKGSTPVIGTTAGIIGCIQANECIKLLLGMKDTLIGKVAEYDGYRCTIERIPVKINPNCRIHNKWNQ